MNNPRPSLFTTLLKSLLLPGALAFLIGCFVVYSIVKEEYDELLDIGMISKAHLLLTIMETAASASDAPLDSSALLHFEEAILNPDEWALYWFTDATGQVIAQSQSTRDAVAPPHAIPGLSTTDGHRVAVAASDSGSGLSVVLAEPMVERNEAIRQAVLGVVFGFVLMGLIFFVAASWAVRRTVGIVAHLSENIAQKGQYDLTAIDRRNSFAEIEPAIDTLDNLMARLDSALAAERAFATNAAHELRTPVAICLAHLQRLKTKLDDPQLANGAIEIEAGLKRLVRLIERLLEMSRAQSGLGRNAVKTDINQVIALLLKELRSREPLPEVLNIQPPSGAWLSDVDPDALGIILGNLFDNMLKYASGPMPAVVDASQPGLVRISNDCDPLSASDLGQIKERFVRKTAKADGYGLGLSIVQELCNQSGCLLDIRSPQPGKARGLMATLTVPQDSSKSPHRTNA